MMKSVAFLYDRLLKGMAAFAAILILFSTFLIIANVASRSFGLGSIRSTIVFVENSLLYFTVLAAPFLVREKAHVALNTLYSRLPGGLRKPLLAGIYLLAIASSAAFAVIAVYVLAEAITTGEVVYGSIDIPFWLVMLPLPVGFFCVALEFGRLAWFGETPFGKNLG